MLCIHLKFNLEYYLNTDLKAITCEYRVITVNFLVYVHVQLVLELPLTEGPQGYPLLYIFIK